ncbi:MAG: lipid A biosynthesis acyltransferase, partial [Prolixibacteraceae bacterium]|nr:lipid A biosynthesis acyltransferase [Prolixibacteraceae bacterium]
MQFKSFGYYILKLLTWPMQLFPLQFHYLISDALYVLIYRIVKYRIKVVRTNLSNSFPGKSQTEIQQIEKNFYHGFSDMFIETLYFTHINVKKHNKRLILNNVENLTHPIAQGRNVIVVAGHFGNWEFMQLFAKKIETNKYFIYKKLNNKAFDRFYSELRSRAAQP